MSSQGHAYIIPTLIRELERKKGFTGEVSIPFEPLKYVSQEDIDSCIEDLVNREYIGPLERGEKGPYFKKENIDGIEKLKFKLIKDKKVLRDGFSDVPEVAIIKFKNESPDLPLVIIDDNRGIYLDTNHDKCYQIGKKRKTLVLLLLKKEKNASLKILRKLYGENNSLTMNTITEINEIFKKKLDVTHGLIDHTDGVGYMLNYDKFRFQKR